MVASKHILVVDDIAEVREGLYQILTDEGYQVSISENGMKALKQLQKTSVDLVITDILMPEMDGMELVKQARNLHPEMQFILISGGGRQLGTDYDYLEVTKRLTGVAHLLKKPFRPDELVDMVEMMLEQ